MAKYVMESDGHTRSSACLPVNVNSPVQHTLTEGGELRLVRAARLIEMHYRSTSPAGSGAAAIVHNLTAIGPRRGAELLNSKQGPSL